MWGQLPPLVNNLQVFPVQEVAGTRLPCQHRGGHVPDDLLLLALCHGREPLLKTQLPLATEEQQEAHLATHTRHKVSVTIVIQAPTDVGDLDEPTHTRPHTLNAEDIINYPLRVKPVVSCCHGSLKSNSTTSPKRGKKRLTGRNEGQHTTEEEVVCSSLFRSSRQSGFGCFLALEIDLAANQNVK